MAVKENLANEIRALLHKSGFVSAQDAHEVLLGIADDIQFGSHNMSGIALPNITQSLITAQNMKAARDPSRTGGVQKQSAFVNGKDPRSQAIFGGQADPGTGASATPETAASPAPTPSAIGKGMIDSRLAVGQSTETTAPVPQPQQIPDTAIADRPTPTYAPTAVAEGQSGPKPVPGSGDSSPNVEVGNGSPTKHPVAPENDEGTSTTANLDGIAAE